MDRRLAFCLSSRWVVRELASWMLVSEVRTDQVPQTEETHPFHSLSGERKPVGPRSRIKRIPFRTRIGPEKAEGRSQSCLQSLQHCVSQLRVIGSDAAHAGGQRLNPQGLGWSYHQQAYTPKKGKVATHGSGCTSTALVNTSESSDADFFPSSSSPAQPQS